MLTPRAFCMLPWLFLEPDVLCYLPVRATNSACVCVGRSLSNRKEISVEIMNQLLGSFVLPGPGPQQPPGGFGAAPGIPGGQEDQGAQRRHQVGFPGFPGPYKQETNGSRVRCVAERPPCPAPSTLCPPPAYPSAGWTRRRSSRLWRRSRPDSRLLR